MSLLFVVYGGDVVCHCCLWYMVEMWYVTVVCGIWWRCGTSLLFVV